MGCGPALAQQSPFEPVLVVNDRAITAYELDQRTRLLQAFGAGGDIAALAREQLIDDRIRLGVAERLDLSLPEDELLAGLENFAQQRELTVAQVEGALTARGIARESLLAFLEAQITWRNVVQALFRARATPTEQDLDIALGFADRTEQESVLMQEIAIPFAELGEAQALELARRLSRELNRGGNFEAAARRHSRAASAARGGRLDWLPASGLPPTLAGQVLALQPGEVTAPVPISNGIAVVKLLDIRTEPRAAQPAADQTLTYSQIIIPLAPAAPAGAEAAAREQADALRREAELCSDLDRRADEFGLGSGRSDPTPVGAVPVEIAGRLAALDPGDKEVFRDGRGIVLLMLCSRAGETSPEDREALRSRLFNQRMVAFSQGYLQELRGDAVIEER